MNAAPAAGSRFLLALALPAEVHTSAGVRTTAARAELMLEWLADHPTRRGIRVVSFGLVAATVHAARGPTGVITVTGVSGGGTLESAQRTTRVRLQIEATINYESLDRAQGVVTERCSSVPAVERAAASLHADVSATRRGDLRLTNVRLHVARVAGPFQEIHAIVVQPHRALLRPLERAAVRYRLDRRGAWRPLAGADSDANVCVEGVRRQLTLQAIGFRVDDADAAPTGGTATAQFAKAQ